MAALTGFLGWKRFSFFMVLIPALPVLVTSGLLPVDEVTSWREAGSPTVPNEKSSQPVNRLLRLISRVMRMYVYKYEHLFYFV